MSLTPWLIHIISIKSTPKPPHPTRFEAMPFAKNWSYLYENFENTAGKKVGSLRCRSSKRTMPLADINAHVAPNVEPAKAAR